jgi:hypothetical protein
VETPDAAVPDPRPDDIDRDLDIDAVEPGAELDLDAVERDMRGVETALERLDAGSYWTDELDGRPIPDEVLEHDPIARRAP